MDFQPMGVSLLLQLGVNAPIMRQSFGGNRYSTDAISGRLGDRLLGVLLPCCYTFYRRLGVCFQHLHMYSTCTWGRGLLSSSGDPFSDGGCDPGQRSAAGGCTFPEHSQTFPPRSCDISCFCTAHSFILTHGSNKRLNIASVSDKGVSTPTLKSCDRRIFLSRVTDFSIFEKLSELKGTRVIL